MKHIFYKPSTNCAAVYRYFENAVEDYPDCDIIAALNIEGLDIIDDEDGRSPSFYVDVPDSDPNTESFINVDSFQTRQAAILFAMEKYGADSDGMISLING